MTTISNADNNWRDEYAPQPHCYNGRATLFLRLTYCVDRLTLSNSKI